MLHESFHWHLRGCTNCDVLNYAYVTGLLAGVYIGKTLEVVWL